MLTLTLHIEHDGQVLRAVTVSHWPCRIGRGRDCEVVLPSWRIARVHAQLHATPTGLRVIDAGSALGLDVNGRRVIGSASLETLDVIEIGGYRLRCTLSESVDNRDGAVPRSDDRLPGLNTVASDTSWQQAVLWRRRLHRQLLDALDWQRRDLQQADHDALRAEIRTVLESILATESALPAAIDRDTLMTDVLDEAVGLGPLQRIFEDRSIGEVMVNAADDIWVERGGRLEKLPLAFSDNEAVRRMIERIVAPLGRRIDESSPMVDARLPDGSRVNAIIPPLALRGPALTIRRFNRTLLHPEDWVAAGAASPAMLDFLRVCVEQRRNIVIAGGTGSGKTTLLNVLSNLIPDHERIVTIEDAAELQLRAAHLVQLEARPANLEQKGAITIRDLVRNALRMRPDRIVVGECRGGECLDMLQAMNTGHDGSLTTVHANSPRDVVARLEVMTLMAGMDLPVQAIREQIAAAVDIVVQQARFADGRRRVVAIMEITGIEAGRVQMQTLFKFQPQWMGQGAASTGIFKACGVIPEFYEGLRQSGLALDLAPFMDQTSHG